jgi:hypothetical protein
MNVLHRMKQMSALTLALALAAQGAGAQTVGSLSKFNIVANPQVVLTGFSPTQPLIVPVVGTSPGITLTLTNASARFYHANDSQAITAESDANILWTSLTAPAGANPVVNFGGSLPNGALIPALLPGINIYNVGGVSGPLSTTGGTATIITGGVNDILIFQVGTLTNTDHDVLLAGGIKAENIYWQVTNAAQVTNDDAAPRGFPGTIVNKTGAQDITIVSSGAGALRVGKLFSVGGKVSVTQSGAGVMAFNFPAADVNSGDTCTAGYFYPSPATTSVGTFAYCMVTRGRVRIKVYNAIGDLASKIEEDKDAGDQLSTMDTQRLAPGVYLYIVERDYGNSAITRSGVKKFVVKH